MHKIFSTKAPIKNPSLSGSVQIEKILEKITPITLTNNTCDLNYSISNANTLFCNSPGTSDLTLNISNLFISGSGSISISILINTTVNKKYFKSIKINNISHTPIATNGYNNLSIDNNATYVLQQFNIVYVDSSVVKIITSLLSLW